MIENYTIIGARIVLDMVQSNKFIFRSKLALFCVLMKMNFAHQAFKEKFCARQIFWAVFYLLNKNCGHPYLSKTWN